MTLWGEIIYNIILLIFFPINDQILLLQPEGVDSVDGDKGNIDRGQGEKDELKEGGSVFAIHCPFLSPLH